LKRIDTIARKVCQDMLRAKIQREVSGPGLIPAPEHSATPCNGDAQARPEGAIFQRRGSGDFPPSVSIHAAADSDSAVRRATKEP